MSACLIYNSRSGSYNRTLKNIITKKLAQLSNKVVTYDIYTNPDINLVDCDYVCVAGGDGTINNVVKMIFNTNLQTKVKLIIVPLGSANILANSLNISKNIILKNWNKFAVTEIEVGKINNHIFLTAGSLGAISNVINKTNHLYKNFFGFSAYVLKMLLHWNIPSTNYHLTVDKQEINISGHSIVFSIGLNIIGFKSIQKRPDGLIDIYLLKNKTPFGFIGVFLNFIFNKSDSKLIRYSAKEIICKTEKQQSFQVDGEKKQDENEISAKIFGCLTVLS